MDESVSKTIQEARKNYDELMSGSGQKPKRSWWFKITRTRWLTAWGGINAQERAVLLTLHLYGGKKNECYPSMRKLAADLALSRNTVDRIIRKLAAEGYVRIEKKKSRLGIQNKYFLLK